MIPSDQNKYCIECKYSETSSFQAHPLPNSQGIPIATILHYCIHPKAGLDLVTKLPKRTVCSFERSLSGHCGPAAKKFEPKSEIIS